MKNLIVAFVLWHFAAPMFFWVWFAVELAWQIYKLDLTEELK